MRAQPVQTSPVGLIGLGLMGQAIAERLLRAGFNVIGWDPDEKQRAAFQRLGGEPGLDNPHVFKRSRRVILSLPNSKIVAEVLHKAKPALRRAQIVADSSTGDPCDARRFHRQLATRGVSYLEATVSGSSEQVRRGEVLVMAGGDAPAFKRCRELFDAFAINTVFTGSPGSAAQMKLVTNLVLGLNRAALAEGLGFARALRLDGGRTLEILRASMAYSRIMDTKGEKMLSGDFKPQARLSQHLKDVNLMLSAARTGRIRLPLTEIHRRILERAESAGLGAMDNSAIACVITQMAHPRKATRR